MVEEDQRQHFTIDKNVVPMEITFMDNGGNVFVLDELIEQMNSYI